MSLLGTISEFFNPITKLISEVIPDSDLRKQLEVQLKELETNLSTEVLKLEGRALEAMAKVAAAEADSDSWLQQNYRPILLIGMFIMMVLQGFQLITLPTPEYFYTIFGTSFGVVGGLRGYERIRRGK